jgi:hypothetical protein
MIITNRLSIRKERIGAVFRIQDMLLNTEVRVFGGGVLIFTM